MNEILLPKWVEVVFGFIIMGGLLVGTVVCVWYQEQKRKCEDDEFADLKKMMPKLPKEKK